MAFSPEKCAKTSKAVVPSPIKFIADDEENDEDYGNNFSTIIDSQIDSLEDSRNKSQDDYAVFVTEDEMNTYQQEPENFETLEDMTPADEFQAIPAKIDTTDEIKKILASLQPPTEDEVKENRSIQNVFDDGAQPKSAKKLFPLFEKSSSRKTSVPKQDQSTKENLKPSKFINTDEDQAIIDVGQKNLDPESCLVCGFVYNPGNAEDEKAHNVHHANMTGTFIKFNGWKNENVVGMQSDGRIIVVKPGDSKAHWEKAEAVLRVVDQQLGISAAHGQATIRNKSESKAYLFVTNDKRVVGFLLAEVLQSLDCVSKAQWNQESCNWLISDIPDYKSVLVGISRIWVASDCRGTKIATRLVKAMEISFFAPKYLRKGVEYAFSHTTPDGSLFASKYVDNPDKSFLTYTPVLAGASI